MLIVLERWGCCAANVEVQTRVKQESANSPSVRAQGDYNTHMLSIGLVSHRSCARTSDES